MRSAQRSTRLLQAAASCIVAVLILVGGPAGLHAADADALVPSAEATMTAAAPATAIAADASGTTFTGTAELAGAFAVEAALDCELEPGVCLIYNDSRQFVGVLLVYDDCSTEIVT